MHLWIITMTLMVACGLRVMLWTLGQHSRHQQHGVPWPRRWQHALTAFLAPPLLLLMTAATMIQMGTEGMMLGIPVGAIGFVIGVGCFIWAGVVLAYLSAQGGRSLRHIQTLPTVELPIDRPDGVQKARLLNSPTPFAGRVGFWQSELVVSQGLFTTLTPDQVKAVLTHEAAHANYRDTFWFFWLGWVRTLTRWLPLTGTLWQELLLLREVRADRRAAQTVDPLLLAEALLEIVRFPGQEPLSNCTTFHPPSTAHRLDERVNALLTLDDDDQRGMVWGWIPFCIVLLPLAAIALHH